MAQTTIRPVKIGHILALNRLFGEAVRSHFSYFPERYQRRVIREHRPLKLFLGTLHPRRILLGAYFDGELVGYAIGSIPRDGRGQLYWLYVDPARRGENIGLALLSRMLKLQRQKGAETVVLATHDHRRYYERQGFAAIDEREVNGVKMDVMCFKLGQHS